MFPQKALGRVTNKNPKHAFCRFRPQEDTNRNNNQFLANKMLSQGTNLRGVAAEVMVGVAPPPDLRCWIFYFVAYFKA